MALPETDQDTYVLVTMLSGLNYFEDYKKALAIAEKELNVTTRFLGTEEYDLEAVISLMDELTNSGSVSGIILLGWEDALIPSINRAVESGIYVCTVCQDLEDSERCLYIGMDNFSAGKQAAELMLEELPEEASVAILRGMSLTNVSERARGVSSTLELHPGISIIADVDTKNDKQIAEEKVRKMLDDHPELDAILALDGISSYATATVLRDRRDSGPLTVCFDKEPEVLDGIASGYISETIVANTPLEVYLAIQEHQRQKHSHLELSADDTAAGVQLIPAYIDPGCYVINRENVQYFKNK